MTEELANENNYISDSRFNMWRGVIALAHADHVVTEEEREFSSNYFDKVAFTNTQKIHLHRALEEKEDLSDIFLLITDPKDRGDMILFARHLFWCDGDFAQQEEKLLSELKEDVLAKLDIPSIDAEFKSDIDQLRFESDMEEVLIAEEAAALVGIGSIWKALIGSKK